MGQPTEWLGASDASDATLATRKPPHLPTHGLSKHVYYPSRFLVLATSHNRRRGRHQTSVSLSVDSRRTSNGESDNRPNLRCGRLSATTSRGIAVFQSTGTVGRHSAAHAGDGFTSDTSNGVISTTTNPTNSDAATAVPKTSGGFCVSQSGGGRTCLSYHHGHDQNNGCLHNELRSYIPTGCNT